MFIEPDAYYQVYNNPKATFECLKAFRQFNPNAKIFMAMDGDGDTLNYQRLARHYNCLYRPYG